MTKEKVNPYVKYTLQKHFSIPGHWQSQFYFKFSLLLEVESCEMFHLSTRIIYVVILTFDENETDVLSLKIEFDMCTNIVT